MTTIQSITSGQKKQYLRFVEDAALRALTEVGPDKDGIQKLIERGDEFQSRIVAGIRELSVSDEFVDEEVASNYGYLSGYSKPRTIAQQVNTLSGIFSGIPIGFAELEIASGELPEGAEGWFAIPRWEKIASTYSEAVELVLAKIASTRKFYNYHEGKLGPNRLRQHERTVVMQKKLGDQQSGYDILVVPAQFGLRHRGRSVRRAREVFVANEFGLGAYEVGIMLLTHPERLADYGDDLWDDLWIDCPSDEYAPSADGRFDHAPYFDLYDGRLQFRTFWFGCADVLSGSASAFLPQ